MRRIVIILGLLLVCAAVSAYSSHRAGEAGDYIAAAAQRSLAAVSAGDEAELTREIGALSAYWGREDDSLAHFVRHTQIDDITRSVARLEALAAYEDYGALSAELASIAWQMEHIRRGERLAVSNLF